MRLVKQGATGKVVEFFLTLLADHVTGATGLSGSIAVTIAKAGGSFGAPSGTVAEMANGWYKLTLDATDTNTLGNILIHVSEATVDTLDAKLCQIVAFDPDSATDLGLSKFADIETDTQDIQSRLPATLDSGNMRSSVKAMDTAVITAGVIATDAIGAAELAADAVTEIQSGLATASNLAIVAGYIDTEVAAILAAVDTEVGDIQTRVTDIQGRLPATLDSGNMRSSVKAMDANVVNASALAADAVTEIQSGLATSSAVSGVQTDVDDIQSRLPATLDGGNMRASVKAMDAGVVTAAVIATDAIDADAIASSAVTEINAGGGGTVNANVIEWLGETPPTPTVDGVPRVEVASLMSDAVDEIWDAVIEGTDTARNFLRALLSGLFGKVQDFTTGTLVFKGAIDTAKTRWTVVTDASGRVTSTKGNLT